MWNTLRSTLAGHKGIGRSAGVGNGSRKSARVLGEDDAISTRRASSVHAARNDGELLERTVQALEIKALVVVIAVRVAVDIGAALKVRAALVDGIRDLLSRVRLATAVGGLVAGDNSRGSADDGQAEEDGGERELHPGLWDRREYGDT